MTKEKYALYGDERICKQLAYILDLNNYIIIKNLSKYNKKYKIILIKKDNLSKKIIKQNKLKKNKDYYDINYIYNKINKGFLNKLTWIKYRYYMNKHNLINIIHIIRPKINDIRIINKIPIEFLKTSEMFIKTVNSAPKNINCNRLEEECNIDSDGYLWGCCPGWIKLAFGNILKEKQPYNTYMARVIKLSSLNKTYCFCDMYKCKYNHKNSEEKSLKNLKTKDYPNELTISIDRSCNLKCNSCRKCFYNKTSNQTKIIEDKLIETGWLNKSDIVLAGQGEVFYSPVYRDLLEKHIKSNKIKIFTNGTLFNKKNWELLEKKYKEIDVSISIDAATKETYKKLRCGNFEYLLKNLNMLGEQKKQGKIKEFQLNYVVQKDNYKEMEKFVELAKKINADKINFTKLNNWGTFNEKEYLEKCMIINEKYLEKDFYKEIIKPIFKDAIVDIEQFEEFIRESEKEYNE